MPTPLSLATLPRIADRVAVPRYARERLSPGILHLGMGNFHRAHQAVYLDRLFNLGRDHDWAIVGAGIMPFDAARRAALAPQDWLGTVVEMSPEGYGARVTGAMVDFCPTEAAAIVERLADPAIRIVSLTITEGGYFIDAETGRFDAEHPDIRHDARTPETPRSVFGILLAGLARRRAAGHPAPTILSCDNIPHNGDVTRQALEGLAALVSPDLRDWVAGHVACPNSMVDHITPATTDATRAMVAERFGIRDAAPVVCEPFSQWVMEDNFPLGRPALEEVGAQFVADVLPYETMKLRILNAGHAAIAYPAALFGIAHVHEAMADPDIAGWLRHLMRAEVIPVLAPIPGTDYDAYLQTCARRFSNPEMGDTIARLCQDGSNRQPKFVLPTIREALAAGRPVAALALEVALWCRYCAKAEPLDDIRAPALRRAARATRSDPGAFLALGEVFGALGREPRFAEAFARQIGALWAEGPRAALRACLERAPKAGGAP
ncbi:MAG: mannitol dehydrogenase family protein [Roseovarius sp.]